METLSAILQWTYQATATWYGAALFGGLLILLAERLARRAEPSDADVRRAAEHYRHWYGEDALAMIGDHMLAASFAPDRWHKRFLERVVAKLQERAITDEDRRHAIDVSPTVQRSGPRKLRASWRSREDSNFRPSV
jgi:hypothetical protein